MSEWVGLRCGGRGMQKEWGADCGLQGSVAICFGAGLSGGGEGVVFALSFCERPTTGDTEDDEA